MRVEDFRYVNLEGDHISALSTYVIHGWPLKQAEVIKEIQLYCSFRDVSGHRWDCKDG